MINGTRSPAGSCGLALALILCAVPAAALQLDVHDDGTAHYHGLHFAHPMFAESISPDTKVRLSTGGAWETDGSEFELELEGEYMFHRSISVEIGVPYVRLGPDGEASIAAFGNVELTMKMANFAFEDSGILLGYGISFGLPTGNSAKGIGSDTEWELEPFVNGGLKHGKAEVVGWARFAMPINVPAGEEAENEVHYDLATLIHLSPRVQALLEVNGQISVNGPAAGEGQLQVSPGVKVAPLGPRLFLGLAAGLPLDNDELDARLLLSAFYHF